MSGPYPDPVVFLRLPDGEQVDECLEVVPQIGSTIHYRDGTFRVVAVEFRKFPARGTYFYPVCVLEEVR